MVLRKLFCGAALVALLSGCTFPKDCSTEEFQCKEWKSGFSLTHEDGRVLDYHHKEGKPDRCVAELPYNYEGDSGTIMVDEGCDKLVQGKTDMGAFIFPKERIKLPYNEAEWADRELEKAYQDFRLEENVGKWKDRNGK